MAEFLEDIKAGIKNTCLVGLGRPVSSNRSMLMPDMHTSTKLRQGRQADSY